MLIPPLTNENFAAVEAALRDEVIKLLRSNPARSRELLGRSINNMRILLWARLVRGEQFSSADVALLMHGVDGETDHRIKTAALSRWAILEDSPAMPWEGERFPYIEVTCVSEMYRLLRSHPCPCGGGWEIATQMNLETPDNDGIYDQFDLSCLVCAANASVIFRVGRNSIQYQQELRTIRPR